MTRSAWTWSEDLQAHIRPFGGGYASVHANPNDGTWRERAFGWSVHDHRGVILKVGDAQDEWGAKAAVSRVAKRLLGGVT